MDKTTPDNNWDWTKREENEGKSDKMTRMTFCLPPPRIQLNQPRHKYSNYAILSHTQFGTSTERYDNFGKIFYVCVARYRTKQIVKDRSVLD